MTGILLTPPPEEINFDEIGDDLLAFEEDDMVHQALHRGVDLRKYGAELEKELRVAEMDSVSQYVENNQQVVDLHKQMQECDAVLARMQEMLLGFQADLGGISEEIKHLQDESLSMSIRLRNR
jgi:vacuolar protein sorting-associated protein 52